MNGGRFCRENGYPSELSARTGFGRLRAPATSDSAPATASRAARRPGLRASAIRSASARERRAGTRASAPASCAATGGETVSARRTAKAGDSSLMAKPRDVDGSEANETTARGGCSRASVRLTPQAPGLRRLKPWGSIQRAVSSTECRFRLGVEAGDRQADRVAGEASAGSRSQSGRGRMGQPARRASPPRWTGRDRSNDPGAAPPADAPRRWGAEAPARRSRTLPPGGPRRAHTCQEPLGRRQSRPAAARSRCDGRGS